MPDATRSSMRPGKRARDAADPHNAAAVPQLTEFEQQRLQRIQRNKQVLAAMGLEDAAGKLSAQVAAARASGQRQQRRRRQDGSQQGGPQEPSRRSRRLASQPAETTALGDLLDGSDQQQQQQQRQRQQQQRQRSQAALSQLDPNSHHNHNLHRIRSMSERALITRARKITNVGKLQSFVQVLEAEGMEAVLQEARQALEELLGRGAG